MKSATWRWPPQTKILRVLQEGEIQRRRRHRTIKVDVRVIAATNKDLEEIVKARTFREDLYYRLNVVRIRMPTLRERLEDIPQIVDYMLQTLGEQKKTRVKKVATEALTVLLAASVAGQRPRAGKRHSPQRHHRPGDTILWKDLPPEIREAAGAGGGTSAVQLAPRRYPWLRPRRTRCRRLAPYRNPRRNRSPAGSGGTGTGVPAVSPLTLNDALDFVYARLKAEDKEPVLERLEREMIARVLKDERGNLVRASERLGMTRTTLRKRIDALGLRI